MTLRSPTPADARAAADKRCINGLLDCFPSGRASGYDLPARRRGRRSPAQQVRVHHTMGASEVRTQRMTAGGVLCVRRQLGVSFCQCVSSTLSILVKTIFNFISACLHISLQDLQPIPSRRELLDERPPHRSIRSWQVDGCTQPGLIERNVFIFGHNPHHPNDPKYQVDVSLLVIPPPIGPGPDILEPERQPSEFSEVFLDMSRAQPM